MKLSRALALLIVLYVGLDLLDPSIRGVFFFGSDHFFVDGVVHPKTEDQAATVPAAPVDGALHLPTAEAPAATCVRSSARTSHRPRCPAVARTDTSTPDQGDSASS